MNLLLASFDFSLPPKDIISAKWSNNILLVQPQRKFEVSIFINGDYEETYYTDHRICEKNSREFIVKYLKNKVHEKTM